MTVVLLVAFVAPPVAYLVVRFGAAGFFNAKQQYEKGLKHEPR